MASSPQKRSRTTAADAAEALRSSEAEDGVRLDRHGNPLKGAAGRPMTPEIRERLAEARAISMETRRLKREELKKNADQRRDDALDEMLPKAFQVWSLAMDKAIERGSADTHSLKAAMAVFEQKFGKATQKVEEKRDVVTKIVYEAAAFQFDLN